MPSVMDWTVTNMDILISNSNLSNLQLTVESNLSLQANIERKPNISLINSTIGNLIGKNINLHAENCHFIHRIQQFPIFVLTGSDATFSNCHVHNVTIKTSHLSPAFNFTKPIVLPKYDPMISNLTVIKAWNSHLIVTNSVFSNNNGSVFDIRDNSHLEIVNSTLSENKGQYGCSVFASNRSAVIFIKSSFTNNWYQNATVTVQRNSRIMVKECEFLNNISPIRSDPAIGSALVIIYDTLFNIIASTFLANVASKGGAIFLGQVGSGQIENCTFRRNLAIQGGAINANFRIKVNISGCTFDNNTALEIQGEDRSRNNKELNGQAVAGAIMFFDSCHGMIENSKFIKNMALYGGALSIQKNSSVEISNCRFDQNWAFEGGGILTNENSSLYSSNTLFVQNSATPKVLKNSSGLINVQEHSEIHGGAIAANFYVRLVLEKCTFVENVAKFGGAINIADNANLTINSSDFDFNHAVQGGAISAVKNIKMSIEGCKFEGNTALACDRWDETCITTDMGKHNFSWKNIGEDTEGNGGGILISDNSMLTITHSTFSGHISQYGAVLTITRSKFAIGFSVFQFNNGQKSSSSSGIINSIQNANSILTHSVFASNTSPWGGVVQFFGTNERKSSIEMTYCNFTHNIAGQNGSPLGAVHNCRHFPL